MVARGICWLAFGIHAVSQGMACLTVQLLLVTLVLAISISNVQGCFSGGSTDQETRIGNRLMIKQMDDQGSSSMAKIFVKLQLSKEEEQNMHDWSFFPKMSNKLWWDTYRQFEKDAKADPLVLDTWRSRMEAAASAEATR